MVLTSDWSVTPMVLTTDWSALHCKPPELWGKGNFTLSGVWLSLFLWWVLPILYPQNTQLLLSYWIFMKLNYSDLKVLAETCIYPAMCLWGHAQSRTCTHHTHIHVRAHIQTIIKQLMTICSVIPFTWRVQNGPTQDDPWSRSGVKWRRQRPAANSYRLLCRTIVKFSNGVW